MDVSLLRQFSSEVLTTTLKKIAGEKDFVIDASLMKQIDKVASMTTLKNCGVKRVFKLDKDFDASAPTTSTVRVYLLPSEYAKAKQVVDQVKANTNASLVFYMIFVPRLLQSIAKMLEEEGVSGLVTPLDYMWQLIPLDSDLLSLELPGFAAASIRDEDLSLLSAVSRSIFGFETLFGQIPTRIALGKKSSSVLTQLKLFETTSPLDRSTSPSQISQIIIMDREMDFISTLLSPVTYEALLDELFGVVCGVVDFKKDKLELSTKDKVFENIRFMHFASIFGVLSQTAKSLRQSQENAAEMNVNEMRDFVQKDLRDLQRQGRAISVHIGASEAIQREMGHYYEDLLPLENGLLRSSSGYKDALAFVDQAMARLYPAEIILRILCLMSVSSNGLPAGDYSRLKKTFCQAYGFKQAATFASLSDVGLLKAKDNNSNSNFIALINKLELIDKSSTPSGTDRGPATAFNGVYTPLICKMVSMLLENSSSFEEFCKSNPATMFEALPNLKAKSNVLVYFVGGYTLAELAALKAIQSKSSFNIYVAGTQNITGKTLIQSFLPK